MRYALVAWLLVVASSTPAHAQIGIGRPSVQIGVSVSFYPELIAVPGYPVYYDPRARSNYFFYDGLYWVYSGDDWYASDWYDGPWQLVGPEYVPVFILRVPVQYYRSPPPYFRGWIGEAPPRWGEHWGRRWEERRGGWDRWDRGSAPRAAPLPSYQRQYSGDRYPRAKDQQRSIRQQNYSYSPHEAVSRQQFQEKSRGVDGRAEQQREPAAGRSSPPQQQQATRSDRPSEQAQPSRSTNRGEAAQRTQSAPREDRGNATPSEDRPREAAIQERERPRQEAPAQQDRGRQATPQQQDKPRQEAPPQQERAPQAPPRQQDRGRQEAPQERSREATGPSQDQGRENKKDDRGQEDR